MALSLNPEKAVERQLWNIGGSTIVPFIVNKYLLNQKDMENCPDHIKYLAVAIPSIHQLYVAFSFRSELYFRTFTKLCNGSTSTAFNLHKIIFFSLFCSRMIFTVLLAKNTKDTAFQTNSTSSRILRYLGLTFCASSAFWVFYSITRYFGYSRATGMDHFYPQKCKSMGFVRKGVYKYVNNAQYKLGLTALYLPGLYFKSKNALIVAALNHTLIWLHYYCTELPDLKTIYGS